VVEIWIGLGLLAPALVLGIIVFRRRRPFPARVVFDNLGEAVCVLNEDGALIDLNAVAEELFVVQRSEAVGKPAADALGSDTFDENVWDLPNGVHELTLERKSKRRWFEVNLSPLTPPSTERTGSTPSRTRRDWARLGGWANRRGREFGRVAVFHEVTHARELQQMRDDLAHMLVHDLRSPIGAIQSALKMLAQDARTLKHERLLKGIDIAERSSERAQRLVDSILDINQLEGGHMPVHAEVVSLGALVDSILAEMQPLAENRRIAITANISRRLPHVRADPQLLDRILRNLMSNALKFTPPDGHVDLQASSNRERIVFTIRDDGPGISPKVHSRLFEKFVTSNPAHGLGLGLAFSKLAVETMGGRIWADSLRESGAAFHFTLPIARRPTLVSN